MNRLKNSTAIKSLLCVGLLSWCFAVNAETLAGKLIQISGPVLVKQVDGKVKILEQNANIAQGDILVTDEETYAKIQFADSSEITLAPKTTFIVEHFNYDKSDAGKDNIEFNFVRGGLHYVPGQIALRNKNRVMLKTSLGNIDGATANFVIEYTHSSETVITQITPTYPVLAMNDISDDTQSDAVPDYGIVLALAAPVPGAKAPGLYVQVIDGIINLSNGGGSQSFAAGQFGYTASFIKPPVILPTNPGMQFTPPPAFSSTTGPSATQNNNKASTVDCEVR